MTYNILIPEKLDCQEKELFTELSKLQFKGMQVKKKIIPLEMYCSYYQVEQTFLETLESHGLITISYRESPHFEE